MSIVDEFGKSFRGTIITDPLIEPYSIGHYDTGGYVVAEHKITDSGKARLAVLGYPSTFVGCLDMIARQKVNQSGKVYESIQSYVSEYKNIIDSFKKVVEI